jgi:hypothetical protein
MANVHIHITKRKIKEDEETVNKVKEFKELERKILNV